MEAKPYTLIPCEDEWILISSLADYHRLHSLASIRALSSGEVWEVHPPWGPDLRFSYSVSTPIEAAHQYLSSIGLDAEIDMIN